MIKTVKIKNFKSIKDSGEINFSDRMYVLAGQNESGKSSILEALNSYEDEEFNKDYLNFEEEENGNFIQEISCIYSVDDKKEFADDLAKKLRKEFMVDDKIDFIDYQKLDLISEYEITKKFNHSNDTLEVILNDAVSNIIVGSIKKKEETVLGEKNEEIKTKVPLIDLETRKVELGNILFKISPQIILFNDFSDLLPDKIKITDLESKNTNAKGYNAVINLEKLLDKDFVSIAKMSNGHKSSSTSANVSELSSKFKKAWKQRIYSEGDLKIIFEINNEDVEGKAVNTIFFYLQTKDNVLLEPRKRSKGMIWFLSAWLELKSMEKDSLKRVVLYDEPGTHLHVKAHKDILNVFYELISNKHQVIYSTHSPSLINTESLHNIGLVINDKEKGTIVEGLTTSTINSEYKQDALQPISEAMGLEPLKDFTVLSKNNVLLEGLSDFWYFKGMGKILDRNINYKFVPGIGIKGSHIYHLISFCIGYGLDWLLIMDSGNNPINTREDLKTRIFDGNENETNKKIKLLQEAEIEDLFSVKDLALINDKVNPNDKRKPSLIVGKKKIVFARDFMTKVENEEINKKNLSKDTLKKFEEVFDWIDITFNPKP